jgi:hypothetical protein
MSLRSRENLLVFFAGFPENELNFSGMLHWQKTPLTGNKSVENIALIN